MRDLQREVTRNLITPHCSVSATAGMPQVNLLLPLQKYSQVFRDRLLACLKSQLCCLHPLCLEIALQFWAGDVCFGSVRIFSLHGERRMDSVTGRNLHFGRNT